MTDPAVGREVTELFAGLGWPEGGDDLLRRSLRPRAPELLLDAPGWLGLGAGQLVLDAGCRDATHAVALARRYGCRVLGVDLVAAWLPTGLADAAAAGLAGRVALVQGDLLALPVADGACDLVWCRDVLSCLDDCRRALRECARVLRPGGGMVLYTVFATDQLAPVDRALLVQGLGNSPASMHQPTVEAAIAAAGFEVVRRERIASEWSEHSLERDPGYLAQDLLEVARLTRDRDRLEAALGPVWYQRALAFALWGVQIVLGRLVPVLYALTRPAGGLPGGSASKEGEAMGGVPLPEGYHSVNPYIVVDGAERLVDFLVAVFAGVEQGRSLRPDGRIDHGDVRIGDSLVMLSEASEAYPARPCVHFVYVEDVDATYRAALAAGATSILEPTEQPWGDRTCGFVDPFDNRWWVATHLRDFS